jgi:VIT1/CCC1 family predicted Fe2+/Mn2+ transporter
MELSKAALYRNVAFGVQDAVVTTMGVISASASMPGVNVFGAGLVSVIASAFSMAIGAYQSEHSAGLADSGGDADVRRSELTGSALVMFVSSLVTGALIVIPWRFSGTQQRGRVVATSAVIAVALLSASAAFVSQGLQTGHLIGNVIQMLALALVAVIGSYAISRFFMK